MSKGNNNRGTNEAKKPKQFKIKAAVSGLEWTEIDTKENFRTAESLLVNFSGNLQ
jgi:choline kinase